MKKSLIALAALTAVAGTASAQSSVTLSGRVDVSFRHIGAGGFSQKQMATDGLQSSNLAFRGVEDLGGGLRGAFWLEAGLDASVGTAGGVNGNYNANAASCAAPVTATSPTNAPLNPNCNAGAVVGTAPGGSPGALFNRRSTLSVIGNFGEIRLGRDLTPTFMIVTTFDPFGTNGVGSATNILDGFSGSANPLGTGAQTTIRSNNTINYFLPGGLGGLYGHVAVAAFDGLRTTQLPVGNAYRAVRLGYAAGPLNVSFATGKTTNGLGGADFTHNGFGGSFQMGAVRVMGQYNKLSGSVGSGKQTNWLVGGVVTMGSTDFRASYGKSDGAGSIAAGYIPSATSATNLDRDATQFAVGAIHNLSKRTALYGTLSWISNTGAGRFTHNTTQMPITAAGKSNGYEFGIRHNF